MITGLDHVALAVKDLDGAVGAYRRFLGREAAWSGRGGGVRHAGFQLGDMALALIAPDEIASHGPGLFGELIRRRLDAHGEGVWALAFRVDDVVAAGRRLERRGLRPGATGPISALDGDRRDGGGERGRATFVLDLQDTAGVQLMLVGPPPVGRRSSAALDTDGARSAVATLDHVVIRTGSVERALALYGARLGLDLRLDRAQRGLGVRQLFFRCGSAIVEFAAPLDDGVRDGPDRFGGLAWRVDDAHAARTRLSGCGFDVSPVRAGRKPGSHVFTLRAGVAGAPSLLIQQGASPSADAIPTPPAA